MGWELLTPVQAQHIQGRVFILTLAHDRMYGDENYLGYPPSKAEQNVLQHFKVLLAFFKKRKIFEKFD